jgi:hypothetical protein
MGKLSSTKKVSKAVCVATQDVVSREMCVGYRSVT